MLWNFAQQECEKLLREYASCIFSRNVTRSIFFLSLVPSPWGCLKFIHGALNWATHSQTKTCHPQIIRCKQDREPSMTNVFFHNIVSVHCEWLQSLNTNKCTHYINILYYIILIYYISIICTFVGIKRFYSRALSISLIFNRLITFWRPTPFPFSGKETPNLMYS